MCFEKNTIFAAALTVHVKFYHSNVISVFELEFLICLLGVLLVALLFHSCYFQELRKAALLVFANKQDIKGCMSAAEISQQLSLTSVKDHVWHIQACCGLTGEG